MQLVDITYELPAKRYLIVMVKQVTLSHKIQLIEKQEVNITIIVL